MMCLVDLTGNVGVQSCKTGFADGVSSPRISFTARLLAGQMLVGSGPGKCTQIRKHELEGDAEIR